MEVTDAVMESPGVYWKPIWNILEDKFNLVLANAKHVKNVSGRKTDVKDAGWLTKLLRSGLMKGILFRQKVFVIYETLRVTE